MIETKTNSPTDSLEEEKLLFSCSIEMKIFKDHMETALHRGDIPPFLLERIMKSIATIGIDYINMMNAKKETLN